MSENEKKETKGEELAKKLLIKTENLGGVLEDAEIQKAFGFCEGYKSFLNSAKTERESVASALGLLKKHGYTEFDAKKAYKPGDKVYRVNRGKAILFAAFGTEPIEKGVNILVSHVDSPRIDLKPRPLYEDSQIAFFKTHYYGGIKKYQWAATPLAIHGVVTKKDGSSVEIVVGEKDDEPVFCITDLLPHLGKEQMKRTLAEGLKGEELNILLGAMPYKDEKASDKVKLNIANILFEKYGITEHDLLSAELTMVPAAKARDVGFDKSMIGSYGHDDRVCAYTSLMAALEEPNPKTTHVTVLTDKEEIGSEGNTGLDSWYLPYFIADLAAPYGVEGREVLSHSKCLSADVNCAFDPTFPDVNEKRNTAYLNQGVVVTKYTGSGGKSSTSDASAEFMGYVRRVLDENNVNWQVGELGKVDFGGGGTVAKYVAKLNADVVDVGVPVLSMHAPFEIVSKIDVYMTYRAFKAFIK